MPSSERLTSPKLCCLGLCRGPARGLDHCRSPRGLLGDAQVLGCRTESLTVYETTLPQNRTVKTSHTANEILWWLDFDIIWDCEQTETMSKLSWERSEHLMLG